MSVLQQTLFLGVAFAIIWAGWMDKKRETEAPQVSEGIDAWEVRRDSRWIKWYAFVWKKYPRGFCEYRIKSVTLPLASFVLLYGLCIAVLIVGALIGIAGWIIGSGLGFVLLSIFQGIVWLSMEGVPNTIMSIGDTDIGSIGWILIGVLIVLMSVAFFRSQSGKRSREFIKLWYTTKIEKWCPPVRVV